MSTFGTSRSDTTRGNIKKPGTLFYSVPGFFDSVFLTDRGYFQVIMVLFRV